MKKDYLTREEILAKVEAKELVKRCLVVNMCPKCGQDLRNVATQSSHWTELACPNRKCREHNVICKSWN